VEMKAGEACLPGKTVKVNGFMKVFVHVYLGYNDLSIYVRRDGHPAACFNSNLTVVCQTFIIIFLA
jgi:hypothetical protein